MFSFSGVHGSVLVSPWYFIQIGDSIAESIRPAGVNGIFSGRACFSANGEFGEGLNMS